MDIVSNLPFEVRFFVNHREGDQKKVIKENGMALKYLSNKNRDNERLVLLACKNNINSLEYASERLKNDREFIINTAIKLKTDKVVYFASSSLTHNKQFNIDLAKEIESIL